MTEDNVTQTEASVEQHSLVQSIVLHLLPGVLILLFYIITAPLAEKLGFPSGTTLFVAIGVVLIPFELGYLLYQGRKRNGTLSLTGNRAIPGANAMVAIHRPWIASPVLDGFHLYDRSPAG